MSYKKRIAHGSDSSRRYIHIIRIIEVLMVVMSFVSVMVYFSVKPDFSASQKENAHLIGVTYMTMNNEFYGIVNEQINHRVEAQGDNIVLRDPALSVERQISQIEEMLDMGIDALVVTPVDASALTEVMKKAKSRGVKIVVVDTELEDPGIADVTIKSDNYNAGKAIGQYYCSKHPEGSRVVVMTHDKAMSGRQRVQGFLDAVSQNEKTNLVGEIPCEGQYEIALPGLEGFIQSGKEFDVVFCLNDFAALGAATALEKYGMLDQVELYGVDASPDAKALINEGRMQASAAQFPTRIGTEAADSLYALLNGETVPGEVVVPVQVVTKANVASFTIDRWQ